MKLKKGFTLIELMVVIAIIAILATIVITNLATARAKSRDTKRISDISQIQLALAQYLNRCGSYPTGDVLVNNDCPTTFAAPGNEGNALPKIVSLGFIGTLPKDPLNTGTFVYGYASPANQGDAIGTSYCLTATLETNVTTIDSSQVTCTTDISASNQYKVTKP